MINWNKESEVPLILTKRSNNAEPYLFCHVSEDFTSPAVMCLVKKSKVHFYPIISGWPYVYEPTHWAQLNLPEA